jgi:hypothetical protein
MNGKIEHAGVKGMKWGVRKQRTKKQTREINKRKAAVSNRRTLSDNDLKNFISRLENEKKLKQLIEADLSPGKAVTKKLLSEGGQKVLKTVATGAAIYGVKVALTRQFDAKEAASYLAPKIKKA